MTPRGERVSPLNIPGWRDFPLRARLATLTGLPVVDNDAKALALGEGWVGAAAAQRDYLAMVVSTGVGGGIVLDGRLLDGADGNAGHIGHVVVEPDGRPCALRRPGVPGGRGVRAPPSRPITGRPAAEAGARVVARTGRLVGRAVASVAVLLDLRLALVAGSVALGYGDAVLRRRAGRARRPAPHLLRAGRAHRARWGWARAGRWWARPRWAGEPSAAGAP